MRKQDRTLTGGGERGYYLVALTLALAFLLGAVGLAIDIGRMYIVKSEAQSFVDSAALYAAEQLDGTSNGVALAQAAVAGEPKKWGFGLNAFTGVQTSFGTSSTGPWNTTPPAPPTGYYFVKVTTTVNLPMYLISAVTGVASSSISASAVAGRAATTTMSGGEFPFSVYTRAGSPDNATDPYGMQIGSQYTLRWGAPGTGSTCGTDATKPNLSTNGKVRGYCCVGQSAATLRQAIVSGLTDPLSIGQPVSMDNGAKNTEMTSIALRVNMDSDIASANYAAYRAAAQGNGERVVVVAVNGGAPGYTMLGFAGFFLSTPGQYSGLGGNDSACAEYIGAWVQGSPDPSPSGSGAFHLRLYQ